MSEKMFNSIEQTNEQPNNPDKKRGGLLSKFRNLIFAAVVGHGSLMAADAISQEKPNFSDKKIDPEVENMEKPEAPKVEIYSYQKENGTALVLIDRKCNIATYQVDQNGKESFVRTETFSAGPAQLNLGGINNGPTYVYKSVDNQGNILSVITFSENNMEWAKDNAETIDSNPTKEQFLQETIYNQWELEGSKEVKDIPYNNEYTKQEFNDLREQTENKDIELSKEKTSE